MLYWPAREGPVLSDLCSILYRKNNSSLCNSEWEREKTYQVGRGEGRKPREKKLHFILTVASVDASPETLLAPWIDKSWGKS